MVLLLGHSWLLQLKTVYENNGASELKAVCFEVVYKVSGVVLVASTLRAFRLYCYIVCIRGLSVQYMKWRLMLRRGVGLSIV